VKERKKRNQTFLELKKRAEYIRFGNWKVNLIIHQGRIIGFDQLAEPEIRFRESKEEK